MKLRCLKQDGQLSGPNRLGLGLDRAPTSKLQAREKVYILLLGSIIANGGVIRPNVNLVNFSPAYAFNSTEEYSLKYQTHDTHISFISCKIFHLVS
jgi:hypothetical protein